MTVSIRALTGRKPLLKQGFWLVAMMMSAMTASSAAEIKISAVEVTGYGIVETKPTGKRLDSTSGRGTVDVVQRSRFSVFTSDIPAVLGTEFGFKYVINSQPRGRQVQVRYLIRFPEGGMTTPKGKIIRESEEVTAVLLGEETFYGFGFDEAWEMVPGEWIFEVWYNKARIVQRSFQVLPVNE